MGETYASTSGVPKLQRGGPLRVARGVQQARRVGRRHRRHAPWSPPRGPAWRGGEGGMHAYMCTTLSIVRPRADDGRAHHYSADDLFTPSPDVAGFGARSRRLRGWVNSSAPSAIRNVPPHLGAALRGAKVCGLVPLSARRGAVAGLRARGCGLNTRGPLGHGMSHAVWECHGWSCSGWVSAAHASSTGFGTCIPLGVPWADEGWFGFSRVRCAD